MANNNKKKPQLLSTRLKKERMLHAMERSGHNISASTRFAQISRDTHYRWLKEDLKYKEAIEEILERALDFTEAQLFKLIAKGSTRAIMFYLNCKGKSRGYGKVTYRSIKKSMSVDRLKFKNSMKSKSTKELLDMLPKELRERINLKKLIKI